MPEAPLADDGHGLVPQGEGWFVLNARDARWAGAPGLGSYCPFEGEIRFPQVGVNVNVLQPGEAGAMYHAEDAQEDFLVLAGEGVLVVEGQERPLCAWDLVHCPPCTAHVLVAAGDRPFVYLAVGARAPGDERVRYPVDEAARRHGASVARETTSPREAYAHAPEVHPHRFRPGDLPG